MVNRAVHPSLFLPSVSDEGWCVKSRLGGNDAVDRIEQWLGGWKAEGEVTVESQKEKGEMATSHPSGQMVDISRLFWSRQTMSWLGFCRVVMSECSIESCLECRDFWNTSHQGKGVFFFLFKIWVLAANIINTDLLKVDAIDLN